MYVRAGVVLHKVMISKAVMSNICMLALNEMTRDGLLVSDTSENELSICIDVPLMSHPSLFLLLYFGSGYFSYFHFFGLS